MNLLKAYIISVHIGGGIKKEGVKLNEQIHEFKTIKKEGFIKEHEKEVEAATAHRTDHPM